MAIALAVTSSSLGSAAATPRDPVCEAQMTRAAETYGVPIGILYSVGLTETGGEGVLHPYDMNIDGRAVHSETLSEALERFAAARAHGARLIDIGCMQIDQHYHGEHFASLADMFDPVQNVRYAAALLKRLRAEQGSWTLAVARYNAGPGNEAAERRYVCSVIAHMVESGVGAWTPAAHAFCR